MKRTAFTTIELLITIFIITLLFLAAAAGINRARKVARDSQRVNDVTSIAAGVDSYAAAMRGVYPVSNPPAATFCAHALSGLNVSLFPNRAVPQDPLPASESAACADFRNGYTFHSRYNASSNNLTRSNNMHYEYAIEVGFELEKSIDDSIFQAGEPVSGSRRHRYILFGKPCQGDANRTCSLP
jgi:type II secretory pathway pseudopilin PulG